MFAEIAAILIFVVMFALVVVDRFPRHIVTLVSGALVLLLVFGLGLRDPAAAWNAVALEQIGTRGFWYAAGEAAEESGGINWATILFIGGMMVMVEGMAEAGFFSWLCMKIARLVDFKPVRIFVSFMILSAVLSMFIDSITVILFLAAVTITLARMLKFNPIPVILTEVFCANLGGSATMCGDPPNIIVGTSLGLTFFDFLANTGVVAALTLVVTVLFFYLTMRRDLKAQDVRPDPAELEAAVKIKSRKAFAASSAIFGLAVVLLVSHSATGLTVATIGLFIAVLTLLCAGKDAGKLLRRVDYKTLLFFIGLFVVVCGLERTGVLEHIAGFIAKVSGGDARVMVVIILWVSAVASAFVDNIPFAATMIPVVRNLSSMAGAPGVETLAWTLSIGTDIGGSATPIGASANVVGLGVAGNEGYPIGWGTYCRKLAPATIIVLAISMVCIFVRYL